MGIPELLILVFLATSVGVGIYLIRSSRSGGSVDPLCGNCGYNLTGSESNRCSECGLLFIQAGIVKGRTPASPNRRRAGIALTLVPAVLILGLIPTLYFYRRALAEQARAMQARQQAMQTQQFLQSMLAATRPAASASRPSDDP